MRFLKRGMTDGEQRGTKPVRRTATIQVAVIQAVTIQAVVTLVVETREVLEEVSK